MESPDNKNAPIATTTSTALGEFVFQSKCEDISRVGFILGLPIAGVGVLAVLIAVAGKSDSGASGGRLGTLVFALIFLSIGVGITWFCVTRTPRLRCYRNGVVFCKGKSERALLFDEVEVFTFVALITKVNLGYSHTTVKLKFEPVNKTLPIINAKVVHKAREGDTNLETLKRTVATRITDRMQRQLQAGQAVEWCSWRGAVIFHPHGLEFRKSNKDKAGTIVPFDQITGYNFVDGILHLFSEAVPKPIPIFASAPNFFPGWYLLFRLANIPEAPKKMWEKILGVR